MNFGEFKDQVLEAVREQLTGEERAYYDSPDGNLLEESLVIRNGNDLIKFGATTASMYRAYNAGGSVRQIAEEIVRTKNGCKVIKGMEKISMLEDYERVKDDLYVHVVCTEKRIIMMKWGIYKRIGDIMLGVYLRINEGGGKLCTMQIDSTYLDKWKLPKEAVIEQAMNNTMRIATPRFYDGIQLLLAGITGKCDGTPIKEFHPTADERRYGCFLSTDKKTNGATAVFYPGVARQICEVYGTNAIYIVLTSIHEVAIHDCRYVEDLEMLSKSLEATIEESTPGDEVASRHIFQYELETDKIIEVM